MSTINQNLRKEILEKQLFRLASLYFSKPTITSNNVWHIRIGYLQSACINELKSL